MERKYQALKKLISIPIRFIHPIRNPFDVIATLAIIASQGVKALSKMKKGESNRTISQDVLKKQAEIMFNLSIDSWELIEDVFGEENALDVHNCDLVNDPRGTVSRIFEFLEVDTTDDYLETCEKKIFKSASRSRDTVVWAPETVKMVEGRMKQYKDFDRYSFESD